MRSLYARRRNRGNTHDSRRHACKMIQLLVSLLLSAYPRMACSTRRRKEKRKHLSSPRVGCHFRFFRLQTKTSLLGRQIGTCGGSCRCIMMLAKVAAALFKLEADKIDVVSFLRKARREQASSVGRGKSCQLIRIEVFAERGRGWTVQ